jgi:multidrug transporter EmrE-like cation transporter
MLLPGSVLTLPGIGGVSMLLLAVATRTLPVNLAYGT